MRDNCKLKINPLGLSLIELLIGIATAGLVGILLVALLTQNSRIFSAQSTKISEGLTLNNATQKIEESIKQASGIAAKYPASGQPQFTTNQITLVMILPSIDAQGYAIKDVYDYQVIAKDPQNNKILRLQLFPDAQSKRKAQNQVLATDLSNIQFSYLDSNNQTITATQAVRIGYIINVNKVVNAQNQQASSSGQVNLRNN
jgi:hypothetical protein